MNIMDLSDSEGNVDSTVIITFNSKSKYLGKAFQVLANLKG